MNNELHCTSTVACSLFIILLNTMNFTTEEESRETFVLPYQEVFCNLNLTEILLKTLDSYGKLNQVIIPMNKCVILVNFVNNTIMTYSLTNFKPDDCLALVKNVELCLNSALARVTKNNIDRGSFPKKWLHNDEHIFLSQFVDSAESVLFGTLFAALKTNDLTKIPYFYPQNKKAPLTIPEELPNHFRIFIKTMIFKMVSIIFDDDILYKAINNTGNEDDGYSPPFDIIAAKCCDSCTILCGSLGEFEEHIIEK